jgi:hypothetical protein
MSSELERMLRRARETLRDPDDAATRRAREAALGAVTRRRLHLRSPLALGVALAAAIAVGIGLGSLMAPSGSAAQEPAGIGFLPESGWFVVQSATEVTPERPAHAIASNVPLSPDDGGSIVPYSTLLSLPPDGIVLVANFTVAGVIGYSVPLASRKLPLRLTEAEPWIEYSGEIRPARPLGQYQLRAAVNGYAVDLHVYFGTRRPSSSLFAAAQDQLDRLVVVPDDVRPTNARPSGSSAPAMSLSFQAETVDRTFRCAPTTLGGLRSVDVNVIPSGTREQYGQQHPSPGFAGVASTGAWEARSELVSVRARGWQRFGTTHSPQGVYASTRRCAPSRTRVPLSAMGLPGPPVQWEQSASCLTGGRVLVRVRAVLRSPAPWRRAGDAYVGARSNVIKAALAIRSERTGKPIAYIELDTAGKTKLWHSSVCT